MITFYANSEEKYLKSVLLYCREDTDSFDEEPSWHAYYDSDGNKPVYEDDMLWKDMFIKGLITFRMVDGTENDFENHLKPVGYFKDNDTGRISVFGLVDGDTPMNVCLFLKENNDDSQPVPVTPGDLIDPSNDS